MPPPSASPATSKPASRWASYAGADPPGRASPAGPSPAPRGAGLARWASDDAPAEVPVPDVVQSTSYTCGPACLLAACAYFGVPATEEELTELAGTTEDGTPPDALANAARAKGLTADVHEGLQLDDLMAFLAEGAIVIIALQAWNEEGGAHDYGDEWSDGHYVIPTSVGDTLVFEDPSVRDKRVTLAPEELLERWHDLGDGEEQRNLGVVVRGQRGFERAPAPVPPESMEPMG